jgi:NAD(P)-dependent dehydrogenase (short-subunit alcohol dehydrogenase family)
MSLKGKVALITGGGKNLGAGRLSLIVQSRPESLTLNPECAKQLAKEGADLALHYNSTKSRDPTLQFRNEVLKAHSGINISVHAGDLGTAAAVEKLFSDVLAEHKKIDIVVNTAGMVLKKPITDISEAEYDQMFAYAVFVDEQRRRTVDQYHAELTRRQLS